MNLSDIIGLLIHYRYLILFPLAAFEGPVIALLTGILVFSGYFNPFIAYFILVFGDIIPDSIYFFLGRHGERKAFIARYGKKFGLTEERFDIIKKLWREHSFKTMFISKLAYGLSTPFLVASGLSGMSAKKFLMYAVPVTVFQYAVLMTLGFYLGDSYTIVARYFEDAQIIIAIAVVALIVGYILFIRYMGKKFAV